MRTPDAESLVSQWLPLAGGLARKWGERFPWLADDFQSDAGLALWLLAKKFAGSPGGDRFAGLVRQAVRWALIRRLDQERWHNPVAFDRSLTARDRKTGKALSPLDQWAEDAAEVGSELEAADEVRSLFVKAELSARSREVVMRTRGHGEPADAIATEQGCGRKRITQVSAAAIEKLRSAV